MDDASESGQAVRHSGREPASERFLVVKCLLTRLTSRIGLKVACFSLEHLDSVPFQVFGVRAPPRPLGLSDLLAVVANQRLVEPYRAVGLVGDEQHATTRHGERAEVERLVVPTSTGLPILGVVSRSREGEVSGTLRAADLIRRYFFSSITFSVNVPL
jgi:hypothetical protein